MKSKVKNLWAFVLAAVFIATSAFAQADPVTDAITDTQEKVEGYVTAIGGALIAIAVLWIGFRVGAKYIRKLGGL